MYDVNNRDEMANKWFIIAKIKMQETMYASWLASNVTVVDNIIYEEGNAKLEEIVRERRYRHDVRDEDISSSDFFVSELTKMRTTSNKDILILRYNKATASLEFIRTITDSNYDSIVDNSTIISSVANFREEEEQCVCTISLGTPDNILHLLNIGSKCVRIISTNDLIESLPEDYKELYFQTCGESYTDLLTNKFLDNDIIYKFTSIIKKQLSEGIDAIISSSTPERPKILTSDATYLTDGRNVLNVYGSIIGGADPYTLQSLGSNYARDKNNVYYGIDIIEEADAESFTVMAWEYAKDFRHGYFKGIPVCNPGRHFRALRPAYGYASDGSTVYYCGTPIEGSDPESFYAVGDGRENGGIYFGADTKNIYFEGKIVSYIDQKTFEHIGLQYFKDKSNVYCGLDIIDGCVPDNVKVYNNHYISDQFNVFFINGGKVTVLPETNPAEIKVHALIATDSKRVYYKGIVIEGADGATTNIFDKNNDGYIVDATSVFYCDKKIMASPKSFETLGFGYARDGSAIFFRDKLIKNADASSFRPTSYGSAADKFAKYNFEKQYSKKYVKDMVNVIGSYFKDSSNVYYHNSIIDGADAKTFTASKKDYGDDVAIPSNGLLELLSSREEKSDQEEEYAQDASNVFFMGRPIDDADPTTFTILWQSNVLPSSEQYECSGLYAKDASNVYYKGIKILNAEPSSFRSHRIRDVWKDAKSLFIAGEIVPYVDIKTYAHVEYSFYKDINSVYYETEIIDGIFSDHLMVLSPRYIKDDVLFCYVERINGELISNLFEAEVNSFDIIESEPAFSFDRYGMFFRGRPIEGIDAETAELVGGEYIKDKDNLFWGNIPMPYANSHNFTFLGDGYSFDGDESYYQSEPLDTKKVVHTLGAGYATDGYLFWHRGKLVLNPETNKYITDTLGAIF